MELEILTMNVFHWISGDVSSNQSRDRRIGVLQLHHSCPRPDSSPSLQLPNRFRRLSQRRRNGERGKGPFINDTNSVRKIYFIFSFLSPVFKTFLLKKFCYFRSGSFFTTKCFSGQLGRTNICWQRQDQARDGLKAARQQPWRGQTRRLVWGRGRGWE